MNLLILDIYQKRSRTFNSWITCSVETSCCGHCDMRMCHSGVDTFVISRLRTKAPDIETTIVVDRSRDKEALSVHCTQSFRCFDFVAFIGR